MYEWCSGNEVWSWSAHWTNPFLINANVSIRWYLSSRLHWLVNLADHRCTSPETTSTHQSGQPPMYPTGKGLERHWSWKTAYTNQSPPATVDLKVYQDMILKGIELVRILCTSRRQSHLVDLVDCRCYKSPPQDMNLKRHGLERHLIQGSLSVTLKTTR